MMLTIAVVTGLACSWSNAEDNLGPEMLVNGDLDNAASGWKLEALEGAKAELTVEQDGYEGGPALCVTVQDTPDAGKLWAVQLYQGNLSFRAGKTYRLSFMAKADPLKWFFVSLSTVKPPYKEIAKGAQVKSSAAWTPYSFDFTVDEDCDEARVLFTNLNVQNARKYLAKLSLKEVLPAK